jgi:hypothetical protein
MKPACLAKASLKSPYWLWRSRLSVPESVRSFPEGVNAVMWRGRYEGRCNARIVKGDGRGLHVNEVQQLLRPAQENRTYLKGKSK